MPTPSSNLTPDISFSTTCPDDQAQRTSPSRLWHESSTSQSLPAEMTGDHQQGGDDGAAAPVSAPTTTAATSPTSTDSLAAFGSLRSVLSSRSATMSPDTVPDGPSPLPGSGADLDSLKQTDTDEEALSRSNRTSMVRLGVDGLVTRRGHARHDTRSSFATDDRGIDIMSMNLWDEELSTPSMGTDYSSMRVIAASPSSYLRPGSKFHGTQQSERQVYDVQVEIKHVDLRESFLCGYLRIQGLTEDHPTLTTYFEGEIIGTKYNFITKHDDWGATDKIDLSHWGKFNAFRPYQKQARKGPVLIRDVAQRENIFMRWKEHFLVPDHRVRTINGASFEGFYYICFNQVKGEVSGIYFHSKSEKFQQLELKHVEDRGCFSAIEFR